MISLDFEYAWISISLIILLWVVFLIKAPSGNCVLGYTVIGLGGFMTFPPYTYASLAVTLQAGTVLWLIIRLILLKKQNDFLIALTQGWSLYLFVLGILWIKIALDCDIYGVDFYRQLSLKAATFRIFLPLLIIFLSAIVDSPDKCIKGIVEGLCLFPCAYFLPLLVPMISEGRILLAIGGFDRLTTYNQDTINGGRMFFLGYVGFMSYAMLRSKTKPIALGVAVACLLLIILNGTRQFLLGAMVLFLLLLYFYGTRRQLWNVLLLSAALGTIALSLSYFAQSQLLDRVEAHVLADELTISGRGEIWKDALSEAIQNPWLGVGFRNFGSYNTIRTWDGEMIELKDSAHGFFQEIMVEHGFVFLTAALAAWIYLLWSNYEKIVSSDSNLIQMYLFIMLTFCVPETFSSTVYFSWGFHAISLLPIFHVLSSQKLKNSIMHNTAGIPRIQLQTQALNNKV